MANSLCLIVLSVCTAGLLMLSPAKAAANPKPLRVILDTDIGDDIDDAFALALLASSSEVKLMGVTTAFGQTQERAQIAAKLLAVMGRRDIPICAGRRGPSEIHRQYDWAKRFNGRAIRKEDAVSFLKRHVERYPGEVTLVCVGPLTNIGDLLYQYPGVKKKIGRIVIMGGSIYQGYGANTPPAPEWNIRCDPAAARTVFDSGVPVTVAGLEVTVGMRLDPELQKRVFGIGTPTTDALAALTNLWGLGDPILYDVVAAAHAMGNSLCETEPLRIEVDDQGMTRAVSGTPNVTLLIKPNEKALLEWTIGALAR